jgi:hypothetical protein
MKKPRKAAVAAAGTKDVERKVKALQSFHSCLFYLIQESYREDLPFVADVLREGISKIDRLSNGDELREASVRIIDNSLYEAMNFLHTLSGLSPAERSDYMKIFELLRQTMRIGPPKDAVKPVRFGLVVQ